MATAYFAVAPALPDLGDGDLPLLVADGIGLIAIAATVWSLLPYASSIRSIALPPPSPRYGATRPPAMGTWSWS